MRHTIGLLRGFGGGLEHSLEVSFDEGAVVVGELDGDGVLMELITLAHARRIDRPIARKGIPDNVLLLLSGFEFEVRVVGGGAGWRLGLEGRFNIVLLLIVGFERIKAFGRGLIESIVVALDHFIVQLPKKLLLGSHRDSRGVTVVVGEVRLIFVGRGFEGGVVLVLRLSDLRAVGGQGFAQ